MLVYVALKFTSPALLIQYSLSKAASLSVSLPPKWRSSTVGGLNIKEDHQMNKVFVEHAETVGTL